MIKPQQYNIYKGVGGKFGAAQFNLQYPHYYCSNTKCRTKNFDGPEQLCQCKDVKMIAREGAVFCEIASAKAANVYDWDNKIIMALSVADMGKIVTGLRMGTEVKLMHDPGAKSDHAGQVRKNLNFGLPSEKGCIISAMETGGSDEPKKHTVPLTLDEVTVLVKLFESAVVRCLAW